ncbi:MAG: hypothetical protein J1F11_10055 [Oscillospiraceae bacterium]|nr:hypothetical protein [Oscillospiraceae bacterium]
MRYISVKKILILFRIIAISAIAGSVLVIGLLYFGYRNHQKKFYEEAYSHFNEVYEYILENKEVYKEFSEYQISLLNDDNTHFDIERKGDMQEMRDIVFLPFNSAAVGTNSSSGEVSVWFYLHMPSYEINCYYCPNVIIKEPEDDWSKVIDDHIWIVFFRTAY